MSRSPRQPEGRPHRRHHGRRGLLDLLPVGVSGSIQERNLFGRGYSLGLQGFVSGKSSYLDLSFVNPRIYDTDFGFSNNSYAIWEEWDDFKKKTIGNTIRLFHPIGEYTSVSVGYRLDRYTLFDIPDTAPALQGIRGQEPLERRKHQHHLRLHRLARTSHVRCGGPRLYGIRRRRYRR